MQVEVVMAGFGGQGLMLIGKLLAEAGMEAGLEVSWLPSYGPEMRGGTANCTVVISDRPVGSPIVKNPRDVVAMNLPSLDKFEPVMKAGGFLVINSALINREASRSDVHVCRVPANEIALQCGNARAANMVALGAYIGCAGILPIQRIEHAIQETFEKKPELAKLNLQAFARGLELAQGQGKGAQ
ncbi:MAG: 2-oxoacid:acceptor oxidoreductase family protein [Candidatus Riflebacteria bacterium]|nr:2-oxoacid:acceptor oxidoreductase family protein [Candidatus Riflebacteria bacterium]